MKRLIVDFSDANDGGAYTGSRVVDLTSDEISEKESQSRSDEQRGLDVIRLERDKRLSETDWWACSDRTMTAEETAYRQALRDITNTYNNPRTVVWPTKP